MLKPIVKVIEVPNDPASVYQLFTAQMVDWWPLDKRTISFHSTGEAAKSIDCDVVNGGAIVEVAADDTRHVWGTFADCDPPNSVAIDFHMGQPKEHSTHLVVSFIEMDVGHTLVKLVHGGWESYGELAQMMRDGYDTGWDEIFVEGFCEHCISRKKP